MRKLAAILVVVLLAQSSAACASLSRNQQDEQADDAATEADDAQRATVKPGPESQPTAAPEQRATDQDTEPWFGPHNVAEWATFFITGLAIIVAWRSLTVLRDQTKAAKNSADAARISAQSILLSERAYVTMTHKPPGLEIERLPNEEVLYGNTNIRGCGFVMEVRNHGRTPARVTDALVKFHLLPVEERLTATPDYSDALPRDAPQYFLVAGDFFIYQGGYLCHQWTDVSRKAMTLYVYGYVDYIDAFGQRHRSGYGRVYDPVLDRPSTYKNDQLPADRSNLGFVTGPSYNYDRPRQKDEGNDWGESVPPRPPDTIIAGG